MDLCTWNEGDYNSILVAFYSIRKWVIFWCFGKCSKVLIQVKLDSQIVASFGLTCCLSKIFHEKKEDKRELMTYRIEPLVRVAIGDIDRPTRCRNMSDNTGTPRNANFSLLTHFLHSGIDIDIKQIGHCKINQMLYEKMNAYLAFVFACIWSQHLRTLRLERVHISTLNEL